MVSCPVCRKLCRSEADRKGRLYHFCTSCGFTFLDHTFQLSPEEEKKRYDLHNNDPEAPGYVKWLSSFMEQAVTPYVGAGARILDFGSGPEPVLASLLKDKGYEVEIYDKYFSPGTVTGRFDMITSTEVFEHVPDPISLLKELKPRLNPGGMIAVKTSFRPDDDTEFFKWWYREDSTHISFFTVKAFEIMAVKTDLSLFFCDDRSLIILRN